MRPSSGAPLSTALAGQAGSRERRAVPLLWGRSPWQRGVRHRACRINTHPLYTSHCLSGIAAQSLFLNSLLYYTGQKIAAACLLPGRACCSPTYPREQAVPHTAWGAPWPGTGVGCRVGTTSLVSPGSGHGRHSQLGRLAAFVLLCCWYKGAAAECLVLLCRWDVSSAQGPQLKGG